MVARFREEIGERRGRGEEAEKKGKVVKRKVNKYSLKMRVLEENVLTVRLKGNKSKQRKTQGKWSKPMIE